MADDLNSAGRTEQQNLADRTQRLDMARQPSLAVLSALEASLLLTVAIKHFDAPSWTKGLIAAGSGAGLLAAPFVTALARRSNRPAMEVASMCAAVSCVAMLVASAGSLVMFVLGSMAALAAMNMALPMVTVTYERNFTKEERGRRVGRSMAFKVACSTVVGVGLGRLLDRRLEWWYVVPLIGALAFAVMAVAQRRIPSPSVDRVPGLRNSPLPHFHLLREDRQLRLTLIAWMVMGFGNLMLLPLRVEFLASPKYGVNASTGTIALYTITIPALARLVTLPIFGALFDRMSFFAARIMVNLVFAAYVAAFFTGTSRVGLLIGATLLGIAAGAGDLMWSLWVTKFAPPGRTADYMGLHTFTTGIRAVSAPLVAFAIVGPLGLTEVALIGVGLMIVSSLVLVPEARADRARRRLDDRPERPGEHRSGHDQDDHDH